MLRKVLLLISVSLLLLVISSCDEPTSIEVEPKEPEPGRRDYVWSIDTLDFLNGTGTVFRGLFIDRNEHIHIIGVGNNEKYNYINIKNDTVLYKGDVFASGFFAISEFNEGIYISNSSGILYEIDQNKNPNIVMTYPDYNPAITHFQVFKNKLFGFGPNFNPDILDGWSLVSYNGLEGKVEWKNTEYHESIRSFVINEDSLMYFSTTQHHSYSSYSLDLRNFRLTKLNSKEKVKFILANGSLFEYVYNSCVVQHTEARKDTIWRNATGKKTGSILFRSKKDFFVYTNDGIFHFNGGDTKLIYSFESDFGIYANYLTANQLLYLLFDYDSGQYILLKANLLKE